jgi:hypothetical protein
MLKVGLFNYFTQRSNSKPLLNCEFFPNNLSKIQYGYPNSIIVQIWLLAFAVPMFRLHLSSELLMLTAKEE